jgi:hypothetical protein
MKLSRWRQAAAMPRKGDFMRAFMLATAALRAPAQYRAAQDRPGIAPLNPPPRATVGISAIAVR